MSEIFLSRRQYDYLIGQCPDWMKRRWNEMSHQWSLGGVLVRGSRDQIENLRCQLPVPEGC